MITLALRESKAAQRCPYCHDGLRPDEEVWVCGDCRAVVHDECYEELERCPSCAAGRKEVQWAHATTVAIGRNCVAKGNNCIAIGYGAVAVMKNTAWLGTRDGESWIQGYDADGNYFESRVQEDQ